MAMVMVDFITWKLWDAKIKMKLINVIFAVLLLSSCDQPQQKLSLPTPAQDNAPAPATAVQQPQSSGGGILEHMAGAAAAGAAAGSAGAVAHNITNRVMDRMAVHKRARRIRKMQRRR